MIYTKIQNTLNTNIKNLNGYVELRLYNLKILCNCMILKIIY